MLGVVSAVGGLATLILHVISLATAAWIITAIDSRVIGSTGLWQSCTSEICINLPDGKKIFLLFNRISVRECNQACR